MQTETQTQEAVVVRRTVNAKPEQVFKAWTTPEELKKWWHFSDRYRVSEVAVDLRVGGKFRIALTALVQDVKDHTVIGTYRDIIPNKELAFSWFWEKPLQEYLETLVTIQFVDLGDKTEIILTHELLPTQEIRESHKMGWTVLLDLLETTLTK